MPKAPKVMLFLESSREYGRQLIFGITRYTYYHAPWSFCRIPGGRSQRFPNIKELDVDGIIAHVKNYAICQKIIASGIPAIIKGYENPALPCIQTDDAGIGVTGAEHLLERGFKNFAFCGYNDVYWSDYRKDAFAARVSEEGYSCNCFMHSKPTDSWSRQQKPLSKWLASLPKPVGLMTCVDDRSQEVLEACKLADIDVPTEVAIVGVDNDQLVCGLARPQLSSIALGVENAGYEAADLLNKLMAGEPNTGQIITTQVSHVEIRQSTDILAMDDRGVAIAIHYIKQHLTENFGVNEVIDAVGIPRRTLQLRFKKEIGRTIFEEIRRLKVEQVAKMLATTQLPISDIAMDLGFPGIDHISRTFRKVKGMSPLEYRKQYGYR